MSLHPIFNITQTRLLIIFLCACGGSAPKPKVPEKHVEMDEVRISASRGPSGEYAFKTYDAQSLVDEGNAVKKARGCEAALPLYAKAISDFPSSAPTLVAHLESGRCEEQSSRTDIAVVHYRAVYRADPGSSEARLALGEWLALTLKHARWQEADEVCAVRLARQDLSDGERLNTMISRAYASLEQGQASGLIDQAEQYAAELIDYGNSLIITTPKDAERAVVAGYLFSGRVWTQRASAIALDAEDIELQRAALQSHAQHLVRAQNGFLAALRYHVQPWQAEAGFRLGNLYLNFWQTLMNTSVPTTLSPAAKDVYKDELEIAVRPLLVKAVRYWELAQRVTAKAADIEPWNTQTTQALTQARARLNPSGAAMPEATASPVAPSFLPKELMEDVKEQ